MSFYQELIFEHSRAPRGQGALPAPARMQTGLNPLCGDEVTVYAGPDDQGRLVLRFTSRGCALCRASASIMVTETEGHPSDEARRLIRAFTEAFVQGAPAWPEASAALGELLAMSQFASRTRCVLLPWEALAALLSTAPDGLAP